ncbi:MAG: hypothetical protein SCL54_16575 [Bacillota bacterium]|nr:hypothetical protein [Bacillota bacterium]
MGLVRNMLQRQYDDIAYKRRENIKTVYELCRDHGHDNEAMKKEFELYFSHETDNGRSFGDIAEKPGEIKYWFEMLISKDEGFVGLEYVQALKTQQRRYLEEYRDNSGLNYVSGLIHLLLGEFELDDGRQRLELALRSIKQFEEKDRLSILYNSQKLMDYMPEQSKDSFMKILYREYPNKSIELYEAAKSDYGLSVLVDQFTGRLKLAIGGVN